MTKCPSMAGRHLLKSKDDMRYAPCKFIINVIRLLIKQRKNMQVHEKFHYI